MARENSGLADHPGTNRSPKGKKRASHHGKKKTARKKTVPAAPVPVPADLNTAATCIDPEWKKFLERYPMIDSIQREDFPDHGVSFIYAAHFYRTKILQKKVPVHRKSLRIFSRRSGTRTITREILHPAGSKVSA